MMGLSILSVLVCAVSTMAWFQIDSQAPEFANTTATPNLSIINNEVTGYKIQSTLGTDGFPDYSSSTVSHKKGGTYETSNNNQAQADVNFDVPEEGLGYYLIKKNPSDTYKYKYNDTSYSWKFNEYSDSDVNYLVIPLITTSKNDTFIVRRYAYNTSTYSTINEKLDITKDIGDFNIDATTYEITPTANSITSYKIWINKATKKVSFEEPFNVATKNRAALARKPKLNAAGPSVEANTVYLLYDSGIYSDNARMWLIAINSSHDEGNWYEFSDSGYKYGDKTIYKCTHNSSMPYFKIIRRNKEHTTTLNWTNELSLSNNSNYCTFSGWSGSVMNFSQSAFSSVKYDGWVIVGNSSTSGSSFYGKTWDANGAIRLENDASNLGKIVVDLKAGDKFKMAYMKGGSVTAEEYNYYANNSSGSTRMEVYGGSVSTYFETDSDKNCKVKTGVNIHCTIYFTNVKNINVNITSSVTIKAVKFDFNDNFEEIDSTDAGTYETTLGATVNVSTINDLSLTIPNKYSRETGNYLYNNSDCAVGHRIDTSFIASSNPHIVYIKVKENPITITLKAFYVDQSGDSTGTIDNSRILSLTTQFGANSVVTASELYTLWHASYSDNLTYSSTAYTYNRVDNSSHNGAFVDGTVTSGTILYIRYVRDRYNITLTPSYFESGGNRLNLSIQSTQTETILSNSTFSTSKTFGNCEYKDHANGIWYVFHRVDSNWYTDQNCTSPYSGKPTNSFPLYAKMVAYPLTTFYIDADNPGWNACYLHMWGTLDGVSSTMSTSLTAAPITTDSGNKLYRISIPTTNITGFLIHNGTDSSSTKSVDVSISSLTSSTSKYLYIGTGAPHAASFKEYKSTSATGVWVQKYSGGSWNNVANGQLLHGDGQGNDYILESGLSLTNNDIIRVCDTKNTVSTSDDIVYGYAKYVDGNKSKHTYVANNTVSSSGDSIKISRLGAANTTARFNFYITHTGYISIAMVPDYGNGFYIMTYNSTDKTENFIGGIKMDSSDYSASYDGWYCSNTSTKIFIRSYLNAVDNICTSLTTTSTAYATMNVVKDQNDSYCITFKETGHYNIRVTNQIVDISPYNVDDFFSLNRLDSSLIASGTNDAKQKEIWRQQTAVVMEIPFTANNPYDATVKLKTECSAEYVGVRFAVYSTQQNDPYNLMRGATNASYTSSYLTDASLGAQIDDVNGTTINAGTSSTYFAYVLIDYRYLVTSSNLIGSVPEVGLYLQIVQS